MSVSNWTFYFLGHSGFMPVLCANANCHFPRHSYLLSISQMNSPISGAQKLGNKPLCADRNKNTESPWCGKVKGCMQSTAVFFHVFYHKISPISHESSTKHPCSWEIMGPLHSSGGAYQTKVNGNIANRRSALPKGGIREPAGEQGWMAAGLGGGHGQIGGLCSGLITPLNRVSSHNKGFIISCWNGYCSLGTCVAVLPARRPKNVGRLHSGRKVQTTNPLCRPIKKPVFCGKCYLSRPKLGWVSPSNLLPTGTVEHFTRNYSTWHNIQWVQPSFKIT